MTAAVGPAADREEWPGACTDRDDLDEWPGACARRGRLESERHAPAVRRSARTLHAVCAELLPGYAQASREPWRQALLTAGCLDVRPRRAVPRAPAPPLIVEDVVQPSDVLCALWLARRGGLFSPGSSCGDALGLRSACEIVPELADGVSTRSRAELWEILRANAAWRAHRLARRNL